MENDLKGNGNCFELTRGSSYRGFESRKSTVVPKYTRTICIFLDIV